MKRSGVFCLMGYIGTIFAANWAIEAFGAVPVWVGLMAPAGVYFAGLAFTLRDLVHESLGVRWVIAAIVAGAAASWIVSPAFAFASATAFLVSEGLDLAVYTPLRKRDWISAVVASNVVGAAIDSALFLWLAFGSLAYLPGQIAGKLWMTALAIGAIALVRGLRRQAVS